MAGMAARELQDPTGGDAGVHTLLADTHSDGGPPPGGRVACWRRRRCIMLTLFLAGVLVGVAAAVGAVASLMRRGGGPDAPVGNGTVVGCANKTDVLVFITRGVEFAATARACGRQCAEGAECSAACIASGTGVGLGCADCFGDHCACGFAHCFIPCLPGPGVPRPRASRAAADEAAASRRPCQLAQPRVFIAAGPACTACLEELCKPALLACVAIPEALMPTM